MAQTIIVDISTRGANPVAYTHQGDTGRTFFAEIYENGEAFAVAGYTIKVGAILPADRGYYVIAGNDMVTATKTNDNTTNKIYFTLSENYSLKAGNGILTLIFTSNTGTPTTIRPINIDLRIQKSADAPETIAGASDFVPVLQRYMAEDMQTYINAWLDAHPEAMQYYISGSKLVLDENGILSIQNDTDEIVEALDLDTLRAEVTDLKSDLNRVLISKNLTLSPWAQGYLRTADGTIGSDSARCVSYYFSSTAEKVSLSVASGFVVEKICEYSTQYGAFVQTFTNLNITGETEFNTVNGHFYRLQLRKEDSSALTPDDVSEDTVIVSIKEAIVTEEKYEQLQDDIYKCLVPQYDDVELTINADGYYRYDTGVFAADTSRRNAILEVSAGEEYLLTTRLQSAVIAGIMFYHDNTFMSYLKKGTGTYEIVTNYPFTIPDNCNKLIIQSAFATPPSLKKKVDYVFAAYTKAETHELLSELGTEKYGIRWEVGNNDDLGSRCFGADGLTATIGEGTSAGSSDFDNIYPWSEMKRCNIKKNTNGAEIVTFEGETGFSLDGSNGDVFVRIPKFYYEHYIDDGYEYHVISATGRNAHPAFVENGKELDEIFVGAFEGHSDNGKLRSIGSVIPTSNKTLGSFLSEAQENGDNYTLYDMRTMSAVWLLACIEFGKRNTNAIFGYGLADFEQPISDTRHKIAEAATATNTVKTPTWTAAQKAYVPVGANITICRGDQTVIVTQAKLTSCVDNGSYTEWSFDGSSVDVDTTCFIGSAACSTNFCETVSSGALSWHTGRANWIANSKTRNPIRYRWIENPVGNLWHLMPDITFDNLQMYQCKNMSDYDALSITGGYVPVGDVLFGNSDNGNKGDVTGYNYWITELVNDYFAKSVLFGKSWDKSLVSTKAFGAYYYLYPNVRVCIANGGGFDHLWRCNMLTNRAWIGASDIWYLYGARIQYKNLT